MNTDPRLPTGGSSVKNSSCLPQSTLGTTKLTSHVVTFQLLSSRNAFTCQCHNQGWQHWLCPGHHPLSAAHGNPTTPPPPPQQSQTNDFDLSSAVQGRSYRYNPPNDVKDLSAKLMNDKNSPPPFSPLPPSLSQPKNTSSAGQIDWEPGHFIDFFPLHPHPHLLK